MTEASKTHVVVVIQVGETAWGLLVDAISDILTVSRDQIRPVPAMETGEMLDCRPMWARYDAAVRRAAPRRS